MDKHQLTYLFLKQAGIEFTEEEYKVYYHKWWYSPFSPRGYRLSPEGSIFLQDILQLQCYKYKIKAGFIRSNKTAVQLTKYITAPFYLGNSSSTITLFGETDAAMMGLYQGDLAQYLENFTR
jgi:hypothetical protein